LSKSLKKDGAFFLEIGIYSTLAEVSDGSQVGDEVVFGRSSKETAVHFVEIVMISFG